MNIIIIEYNHIHSNNDSISEKYVNNETYIYVMMYEHIWQFMHIYIHIYDDETIVFDDNYSNLLPVPGWLALLFLYILDDFRVSGKL